MRTSTTTRLAWLVPGSVFAVATLGWGTFNVVDLLAHERHHEQVTFAQPVTTVQVDTDKGSVHIVGDAAATNVTVDSTVSEGLFSGSHSVIVDGDRLVVRSDCPPVFGTWCGVDYTIRVPAATAVAGSSSGSGIDVTGTTGPVDLSSSGGGLHVTGGGDTVKLASSGGGVTGDHLTAASVTASSSGGGVHLSFTEPPQSVKASSSGGGVRIEVPDVPGAYAVHASSSGGGVHNGVRTDPSSTSVIDAESSGGGVTITYPAG